MNIGLFSLLYVSSILGLVGINNSLFECYIRYDIKRKYPTSPTPILDLKRPTDQELAKIIGSNNLMKGVAPILEDFITCLDNDEDINPSYLWKNLPTLMINEATSKERAKNKNTCLGCYQNKENKIVIFEETPRKEVVFHELLHVASRDSFTSNIGYCQFVHFEPIGFGINEGTTELLNTYYRNEPSVAYHFNYMFMKNISEVVGLKAIKQSYFNCDAKGFIDSLESFSSVDKVKKCIMDNDFVMSQIYKKSGLTKSTIVKTNEACERLYTFFEETRSSFLEGLHASDEIDDKRLSYEREFVSPFICSNMQYQMYKEQLLKLSQVSNPRQKMLLKHITNGFRATTKKK